MTVEKERLESVAAVGGAHHFMHLEFFANESGRSGCFGAGQSGDPG